MRVKTSILDAKNDWDNETYPEERRDVLGRLGLGIDYDKAGEYCHKDFDDLPKYIQKSLYHLWIKNKLYDKEDYIE